MTGKSEDGNEERLVVHRLRWSQTAGAAEQRAGANSAERGRRRYAATEIVALSLSTGPFGGNIETGKLTKTQDVRLEAVAPERDGRQ